MRSASSSFTSDTPIGFFPGTSVLHTRLRYVLFIPWIYADVRNSRRRHQKPAEAIVSGEHKLTERLRGQDGVIGGRVHPETPDQPPSYVYWTALQTWGLLRQRGISGSWSRKRVEELLAAPPAGKLSDDDGLPIDQTDWPFAGCLEPSKDWSNGKSLSFKLKKREQTYLARQLRSVDSPVSSGEPSLLSMLVGKPLGGADHAWSPEIVDMARHERTALMRAGQAAGLAAIGRAIYAAQVETLKTEVDCRNCSDLQRNALAGVVADWRAEAAALDWPSFEADMNTLPPRVSEAPARDSPLDSKWQEGSDDPGADISPLRRSAQGPPCAIVSHPRRTRSARRMGQ